MRKQCLLPLIKLKLQILLLLLSNRMLQNHQREFSNTRTSDSQWIFSDLCSPDYKHQFSNKRSQIASNQNDACPHHLAMLVTSCWCHQTKGKGTNVYTVLLLMKTYLKPNIRWKYGFNSCDKGLIQEMITLATTVTSTMQIVEYHVKYNTIIDQIHLKQTTVVVGGKGKPRKKGYHGSYKYYLKHIVRVLLDRSHNRHLVLLPRQNPCCVPTQIGWFHSHEIRQMGSPRSIS